MTIEFEVNGVPWEVKISGMGRRQIFVDGQLASEKRKLAYTSKHEVQHDGKLYEAAVTARGIFGFRVVVSADGEEVFNGSFTAQGKPFSSSAGLGVPAWAWLFVVACGAIPIVTLGGAIPGALGIGGAAACAGVAQKDGLPQLGRVGICLGITAACWTLLGLLVMAVASAGA